MAENLLQQLKTILNDVWDKANHQLMASAWAGSGINSYMFETDTTILNDVWDPVNHSLKISGASAGNGTTIISGSPTIGQAAEWTSGTAITGVDVTGTGNYVKATSPTLVGGSITALTAFGLKDTTAAFDVIIGATSSATLTANRILTLGMGNVAHTINLGTTANTITFPNVASGTVPFINNPQVWTATQTFANVAITSGQIIYPITPNTTLTIDSNTTTSAIAGVTFANVAGSFIGTSGDQRGLEAVETFAPTSGTATFSLLNLTPTINQTGGASGITRGIYINPTLTAAADFRALEIALGSLVMATTTDSTTNLTGSIITAGGVGISKSVYIGGSLGIKDTTAAFNVITTMTSSATLTANRTLTIGMGNVDHTILYGTTANTITFPNAASGTVPFLNLAQTWTTTQTFASVKIVSGGSYLASLSTNSPLILKTAVTTGTTDAGIKFDSESTFAATSGAQRHSEFIGTFAPTSGTGTFTVVNLTPTINQTGGASGVTSALAIAPILTAAAAFTPIDVQLALVAGGARVMKLATSGPQVVVGSGAPSLSAAQGSIYLRSDGSTGITRAYINTDGSTTWTAITTVA